MKVSNMEQSISKKVIGVATKTENEEGKNNLKKVLPSNVSEFNYKSFRGVIEKKEDEENPKFPIKGSSSLLRRTGSKFGVTELFSNARPKISRINEPVFEKSNY